MNTLPEYLDRDAWDAFVEVRKRKGSRAPFTEYAAKLILRKLDEFWRQGWDPNHILEASIENGWSGVFICRDTPRRQLSTAEQATAAKVVQLASSAVRRM